MAQQYLLPCECGKANIVSTAQAGRSLTCSCGRDYVVPSLVGLRQLEPAEFAGKKSAGQDWNSSRGVLFAFGTLLTLIGLALGAYGAYYLRRVDLVEVEKFTEARETEVMEGIEKMSPIDVYDTWKKILRLGPGQPESALSVQAQRVYNYWFRFMLVGVAIAAVGILMAGGSLIGSTQRS